MAEPAVLPAPRKRRRWWLLLVVPLLLVVVFCLYLSYSARLRLERAIAEADRLDPHWRLADLQADRADIPDEENAALVVDAARAKMPGNWNPQMLVQNRKLYRRQPNARLTEEQTTAVREVLKPGAAALTEARQLADRPRGRSSTGSNLFANMDVARLLFVDAFLRSAEGDIDGALVSCRGTVNCGRSLGDEPAVMAQLVRLALDMMAAQEAQEALGQGEASDAALAALQQLLAEEGQAPLITIALRGERAEQDRLLESVQRGEMSVTQLVARLNGGLPARRSFSRADLFYLPAVVANSRAKTLEEMNKLIEISKMPSEQQTGPLAALLNASQKGESLAAPIGSIIVLARYMDDVRMNQAQIRCAAAGLAVERYRLKHGHWPEGLGELKEEFLREVPADPFDGQPLRYHRNDEGAVIYAMGPDRKDDPAAAWKGAGISFRLWDVDKRRQPPAPESRR